MSLALLLLGKMQLLAGARVKQKSQQTHPQSVLTGQDCPYDHTTPTSPPKSGICSHQRCSISTRGRAISALNAPATQQDRQSRKAPAQAGDLCVRGAHVQVQSILCCLGTSALVVNHISFVFHLEEQGERRISQKRVTKRPA